MFSQFLSEKEWLSALEILPELQPAIAGSGQWHSAAVPLSSTSAGTLSPQRERPSALATVSAPGLAPEPLHQDSGTVRAIAAGTERFTQPERPSPVPLHLVPERVSPTRLTPRMQQVYDLLDAARAEGLESYPELLAWVACHSGQRCSRRMVSAWKQDRFSRPVRSGAQ